MINLIFFKVGAIGVALAIEYDRTGVFTFLVPAVVGIFVLLASWVSQFFYLILFKFYFTFVFWSFV